MTPLAAAANVAANLRDLGTGAVRAIGVVGSDAFGAELRAQLARADVDQSGVVIAGGWQTAVYGKPHLGGTELERLDFGMNNELTPHLIDELAARLAAAAHAYDAVVINQQVQGSVTSEAMVGRIHDIVGRYPRCTFVADARERVLALPGVVLRCNEREARALAGPSAASPEVAAALLCERTGAPVFVTLGPAGMLVADSAGVRAVPGVRLEGPVDPVGAGDTAAAAIAAALGSGCDAMLAARLANVAAAVTVAKLGTTGTATPRELLALIAASG